MEKFKFPGKISIDGSSAPPVKIISSTSSRVAEIAIITAVLEYFSHFKTKERFTFEEIFGAIFNYFDKKSFFSEFRFKPSIISNSVEGAFCFPENINTYFEKYFSNKTETNKINFEQYNNSFILLGVPDVSFQLGKHYNKKTIKNSIINNYKKSNISADSADELLLKVINTLNKKGSIEYGFQKFSKSDQYKITRRSNRRAIDPSLIVIYLVLKNIIKAKEDTRKLFVEPIYPYHGDWTSFYRNIDSPKSIGALFNNIHRLILSGRISKLYCPDINKCTYKAYLAPHLTLVNYFDRFLYRYAILDEFGLSGLSTEVYSNNNLHSLVQNLLKSFDHTYILPDLDISLNILYNAAYFNYCKQIGKEEAASSSSYTFYDTVTHYIQERSYSDTNGE